MTAEENSTPFVRITNREVYDIVSGLRRDVQGLQGAVADVLGENVELRKRVRGLELRFYGIAAGLLGAIVMLIGGGVHGP